MRILSTIFLMTVIGCTMLTAQMSNGFNFQAVARNADGVEIKSTPIKVIIGIHKGMPDGELVWQEEQNVITNEFGLFSIIICGGQGIQIGGSASGVEDIDWETAPHFMALTINDGSGDAVLPVQPLLPVPYSKVSESLIQPVTGLTIQSVDQSDNNEALFEVRRADGYPVFAVYEDGVYVYTDTAESVKGIKGGFAVGGYTKNNKGLGEEYMRVTADSIRFYVGQDESGVKGVKGGFAVGGYTKSTKSQVEEYLKVSPDSVRIYIDDDPFSKGIKGGFAVGGYTKSSKESNQEYFNISGEGVADIINGENRVVWYPKKNAFLTGNVLVENPDSVGENSLASGYQVKAIGNFSQAFGFRSIARGDYSMAIGKNAVANTSESFAMGDNVLATGANSYAFGTGVIASGTGSFALGGVSQNVGPTEASGDYSISMGLGNRSSNTGAITFGYDNVSSGTASFSSGTNSQALGERAIAMGFQAYANGYAAIALGPGPRAEATGSVALGWDAQALAQSFAAGRNAKAQGVESVAIGRDSRSIDSRGIAIGYRSDAQKNMSIAIGTNAISSGDEAVAVGNSSNASGNYSVSLGRGVAGGNYATNMGFSFANADYSVTMGNNVTSGAYASVVIGYNNVVAGSRNEWKPTDPIFVVGNGYSTGASNAMTVYKDGNMTIKGTLTQDSDIRIKKEIDELSPVLKAMEHLRPVSYEYVNEYSMPGGRHIGFVAQELKPYFPELVMTDSEGMLSVNYSKISVLLVKALQEQQDIIREKEKEIEALNERLTKLEEVVRKEMN